VAPKSRQILTINRFGLPRRRSLVIRRFVRPLAYATIRSTGQTELNNNMIHALLVADSHLGFGLPLHPRVERRRRGPDFFANLELALQPALRGEVDLVVHGGDLLFRSRVPDRLVQMAMAPLVKVAAAGVPVVLVPGNHERSRIPLSLWTVHPNLWIFRRPCTFTFVVRGIRLAVAGFPCSRHGRDEIATLLEQTAYRQIDADIRLLCMHQTVEGAQVGVQNYTFRHGPDVIRGRDLPGDVAAVLAGHIHRAQALKNDLAGRPLPAPVVYPGSVERTAFAEREEVKGYAIVELRPTGDGTGRLSGVRFIPLPTRPMVVLTIAANGLGRSALEEQLRSRLRELDPAAIVAIEPRGPLTTDLTAVLSASSLRALAPTTMNVEVRWPRNPAAFRVSHR
jgi:exonuclease SbcD